MMTKNRRLAAAFCLFSSAFIAGGIGAKRLFTYSPLVGYSLGALSIFIALYFAVKDHRS
ncbi:hypothetical protein ACFOU2_19220 [Bacillus songklensis]|uniref:Uncharacterized protein n=1 Tax=Bacillus songklensis TaxID=1069116 RepID=A0ABV8B7X7_9BACI